MTEEKIKKPEILQEEPKIFQKVEVPTQAELNEKLKAQIAEIFKNKGSNGNIGALLDENGEPKKLYHTADSFDKIGRSNLEFNYEEDCYKSFLEKNNDKQDPKASEQGKSDKDKFNLLRKSIIQSSAIRDKHLNLQEVLQEKGLKIDNLDKYSFKSLDQLIDGDNFKDEFKADLKNLGFGEGENGIWTKGEGENAVTYDTNQPYVKDFLINAYYEENFNKFQETLEKSLTNDKSATLEELEKSAVERYNAKQKLEFVEQVSDYQKFKEDQKQGPELKPNYNTVLIANIIDWNSYSSVNLMGTAVTDYETRFNAEKRTERESDQRDNRKICVNSKSSLLGLEYRVPEDKSYVGYGDKGLNYVATEAGKQVQQAGEKVQKVGIGRSAIDISYSLNKEINNQIASIEKTLGKFIVENVGGSKIPGEKGTDNGKGTDSGRN